MNKQIIDFDIILLGIISVPVCNQFVNRVWAESCDQCILLARRIRSWKVLSDASPVTHNNFRIKPVCRLAKPVKFN